MKYICKNCGKEFQDNPSDKSKYCSQKCYWESLKGKKHTVESNEKRRKKMLGKPSGMLGKHHTEETKIKISQSEKGRKQSTETKNKIRESLKGEKHFNWHGNNIKYRTLHAWVARWRGKPSICEMCGTTSDKRFEWANKSGEYKRDLSDWLRLCNKCHKKYDRCLNYACKRQISFNLRSRYGCPFRPAFSEGI